MTWLNSLLHGEYAVNYALSLPMIMLTLFALGILVIDLALPKEWKRINALTALAGVAFAFAATAKLHLQFVRAEKAGEIVNAFQGFGGSMLLDRFAIYFYYLFLLGTAVAILISVRYLEIEREDHGEFYALTLFSVVGMM